MSHPHPGISLYKNGSDINNSSCGQFYSGFINDLHLPIKTACWYNISREDRESVFLVGMNIPYSVLMWKRNCCNFKKQICIPNYYRIFPSNVKLVGLLSIVQKSINVYKKNCSFIINLYIICIKKICYNFYGACLY